MSIANETYTLGGGDLHFAQRAEDGSYGDFYWWGRVDDDLKVTMEVETLPHPNFSGKLEEIDDDVEISKAITMGVTTDDMSQTMVSRFFSGEIDTVTQTGATLTAEDMGEVNQGGIYETGFIDFASLAVDTYIEGTDYSVDLGAGTFAIIIGGGISDATTVAVTGTYNTVTTENVQVGTKTKLEGKFKFISNQTTGIRRKTTMHKCSVIPSGDFGLMGTKEWTKCTFDVKILKDETIVTTGLSKYMLIEEIA